MSFRTMAVVAVVVLTLFGVGAVWLRGSAKQPPVERVSRAELEALKEQIARMERSEVSPAARDVDAPSAPAGALDALRAELRAMRAELTQIERRLDTQEQDRDAAWRPSGAPSTTPPLAPYLDELLASEGPADESSRLAAQLRPTLLQALPDGASLRELVCSSSLCRAEISYRDLVSYQGFVETRLSGAEGGLWNGPVFQDLVTDPDTTRGDLLAMLYLAREASVFHPR